MDVTVLGKSPSWPDSDGACSGYLVREDDFTLLLDCGTGVFSKLRTVCDYAEIDAIMLSHMHPDHFLDLVPLSFAIRYSPRGQLPRPELHVPPGAHERLQRLSSSWGREDEFDEAYRFIEYDPDRELTIGPLRARFREVPHYVRAWAVELTDRAGRRFTFGADCGPNEGLIEFAHETDLLIVEAAEVHAPDDDRRGHMTAREAGELARAAGARRVVITHYSDEFDLGHVRDEAAAGFGGEVELAHEGASYTV